jgi:hypothetical protein
MSRKTRRITTLGVCLAALVAFAATATSASAINFFFQKYNVNGTLTPKKLNQTITLATGEFNGKAELNFVPEPETGNMAFGAEGPLTGTVTLPPFTAEVKLFGIPAKLGTEFEQVGASAGKLTSVGPKECGGLPVCENLSVPTNANIRFTAITILGLTIPEKCETIQPVFLNLDVNETLAKLLGEEAPAGSFFTGTANFPIVVCRGLFGLINGPLLTALFSGPGNPYAISVTPPA